MEKQALVELGISLWRDLNIERYLKIYFREINIHGLVGLDIRGVKLSVVQTIRSVSYLFLSILETNNPDVICALVECKELFELVGNFAFLATGFDSPGSITKVDDTTFLIDLAIFERVCSFHSVNMVFEG